MGILQTIFNNFRRLFVWWVIVTPWEQVVRVRLGKYLRVMGEGIHLKIPYIDEIYRQTTRRRVSVTRPQIISTRDGKHLTVSGQVLYAIHNLEALYLGLHHAEEHITALGMEQITEFVVNNRSEDVTPQALQKHVDDYVKLDLGRYGIGDVKFVLTNFAYLKAHRFVTGEITDWTNGDSLDTVNKDTGEYI